MATRSPLVVIVGPTASGKTALAVRLAERFRGEIICADSRTVYKGMDIGTAKPTAEEQRRVPHWGIDLVDPDKPFSAADFKQYALQKIEEIRSRGAVPFLVGGTGLYVDSVVFDFEFGPVADEGKRSELETLSIEALIEYCLKNNVKLPENKYNKRYLIRAIERKNISEKRSFTPKEYSIIVGIATEKTDLQARIATRAEEIVSNVVVNEASELYSHYDKNHEAMSANVYPIIWDYIESRITLEEAKRRFSHADWRLAKRQMTWFRRNPHVEWCGLEEAEHYLSNILASAESS